MNCARMKTLYTALKQCEAIKESINLKCMRNFQPKKIKLKRHQMQEVFFL